MEDKAYRTQTGFICIFFVLILCAEVIFGFMRYSTDGKSKYLIDENQKVSISMSEAVQATASIYSEITTRSIPAILESTYMVRCVDYTDLATSTLKPVSTAFPKLKEPASTVYVTFQSISIEHSQVKRSNTSGSIQGEKYKSLLTSIDDSTEGLEISMDTNKLINWSGKVCFMIQGSKSVKKNRKLKAFEKRLEKINRRLKKIRSE